MIIVWGLIFAGVGFFLVWKTELVLSWFGRIAFFDQYLGVEGGSRLGYKLIGILLIFLGFLMITGLYNSFMGWLLSPLINTMNPGANVSE